MLATGKKARKKGQEKRSGKKVGEKVGVRQNLDIQRQPSCAFSSSAADLRSSRESFSSFTARAIDTAAGEATAAVAREDFAAAMSAMAKLRPHVDAYFDKVTVNVDDAPVRANRLKLLNQIRVATRTVADFSKIEG